MSAYTAKAIDCRSVGHGPKIHSTPSTAELTAMIMTSAFATTAPPSVCAHSTVSSAVSPYSSEKLPMKIWCIRRNPRDRRWLTVQSKSNG